MKDNIELRRRLAVIWDNHPPYRMVPKAVNGGPDWKVFDRRAERNLSDEEVIALTFEQCTEKLLN